MDTKALLYGIIGFMLGGLLVSIAATTFDKQDISSSNSHSSLSGKKGDEFDKLFIDEMIVHHEGAIEMAELALSNAKHEEIKDMSEDIISAQQDEIDRLLQWQKDWGYPAYEHAQSSH